LKIEQRAAFLKKLLQDSGLSEYGIDDTEIQKIVSGSDIITILDLIIKLKTLAGINGYSVAEHGTVG
jgi:hypothetical protein